MVSPLLHGRQPPNEAWPALPLEDWQPTYDTLHMWTQIVGKTRLAMTPLVNHWWNVPLYVTARGLSTGFMPWGDRNLTIEFDFIDHNLIIDSSDGRRKTLPLIARPVADFYKEYLASLQELDVHVAIWPKPVEFPEIIPFDQDRKHASYDAEYAHRLWQALLVSQHVFEQFRARFLGKCSPVHFFWGSFDLAVTRFSGRRAPLPAGADRVTREAYSHECISHGFWPGGSWFGTEIKSPIYYSYTVPAPPDLPEAAIRPDTAYYHGQLKEFVLAYDDVRQADRPHELLLEFLQSTYEAGANLSGWDRQTLERDVPAHAEVGPS